MRVDGLHHVTAITADIETNLDFYRLAARIAVSRRTAGQPDRRRGALYRARRAVGVHDRPQPREDPGPTIPLCPGARRCGRRCRDDARRRRFGPVVNLAARAVKLAANGEVTAPAAVAADADIRAEP
jgi:catechol 2,3-dioxygenase-like lactoylglutathione lyase family enzyme